MKKSPPPKKKFLTPSLTSLEMCRFRFLIYLCQFFQLSQLVYDAILTMNTTLTSLQHLDYLLNPCRTFLDQLEFCRIKTFTLEWLLIIHLHSIGWIISQSFSQHLKNQLQSSQEIRPPRWGNKNPMWNMVEQGLCELHSVWNRINARWLLV